MAIHWDYIKGLEDTNTNRTFIKFTTTYPKLGINGFDNNTEPSYTTYGELLTSSNIQELYDKTFALRSNLNFLGNYKTIFQSSNNNHGQVQIYANGYTEASIGYGTTLTNGVLDDRNGWTVGLGCGGSLGEFAWLSNANGACTVMTLTPDGLLEALGGFETYSGNIQTVSGFIKTFRGNIIASNGYVQAKYFNATSDLRAKHSIIELPSALSYVLETPICSFIYNNDHTEKRTIGVIAQNLLNRTLYGINFVNIPEDPNEMLTVNESKFVYLLWKAIQEQQVEIELNKQKIELQDLRMLELEKKIEELREKILDK